MQTQPARFAPSVGQASQASLQWGIALRIGCHKAFVSPFCLSVQTTVISNPAPSAASPRERALLTDQILACARGFVFPPGRPKGKCAPLGGRELHAVSERGGHITLCKQDLSMSTIRPTRRWSPSNMPTHPAQMAIAGRRCDPAMFWPQCRRQTS